MPDNLETFNKLVNQFGENGAAINTFTGKVANELGFSKVQMGETIKDAKGYYISVDVLFKK